MTADTPEPDPSGAERPDGPTDPGHAPQAYPMVGWPAPPAQAERPPRDRRRIIAGLGIGTAATVAIVLLGAPLGLLWFAVAPSVPAVKVKGGAIPVDPQMERFVAADGWFSLLGLVFGVLAAVAVWLILRHYRGPAAMVAAVLGSVGAASLAWWLGSALGLAEYHRLWAAVAVGDRLNLPPELRAGGVEWVGILPIPRGVLLLPAFATVVAYTLLAGWSRYPSLHPEPDPTPTSWGSAAQRTLEAAPAPPAPGGAEPSHG